MIDLYLDFFSWWVTLYVELTLLDVPYAFGMSILAIVAILMAIGVWMLRLIGVKVKAMETIVSFAKKAIVMWLVGLLLPLTWPYVVYATRRSVKEITRTPAGGTPPPP